MIKTLFPNEEISPGLNNIFNHQFFSFSHVFSIYVLGLRWAPSNCFSPFFSGLKFGWGGEGGTQQFC